MAHATIAMEPADQSHVFTLAVAVRLQPNGPEIKREPITSLDLTDLYSEVWLAYLRSGHPATSYSQLSMCVLPVFREENRDRCDGFVVQARGPNRETTSLQFDIRAVYHVAQRASKRLLETSVLQPSSYLYYELVAERRPTPPPSLPAAEGAGVGTFVNKHIPLKYLNLPLQPLLEEAKAVGSVDHWIPVFYTLDVLKMAERFSREGAKYEPAQESGGVVLGSLCSCPDSGEFFVLATDVIQLFDADQTSFSLTYSNKTWARIQQVVRTRQANPATRTERIVGQCHGHNFLPCAEKGKGDGCEQRRTCQMTSAFVSEHDLEWSRSVFVRQPWAFCHIFGLDARGRPVHRQFGFRSGRLTERGYYLMERLPMLSRNGDAHHSVPKTLPSEENT
ncbi:MAG: hypothetical protein JSU72_03615 [Deltaproteobacteria bacterium]|nr:MAG: hypothetical protein JSU72_03615 [Deltaproteobacteria bacterium]